MRFGLWWLSIFWITPGDAQPPPVPFLERGGSTPAGQKGAAVFLDPRSGDAVALYPEMKSDGCAVWGKMVRVVVELARHVEPAVRTDVAFDRNLGLFQYRYTLSNGPSARQPAWKWLFEHLWNPKNFSVSTPHGWTHEFPITGPTAERHREKILLARSVSFSSVDSRGGPLVAGGIKAGSEVSGFRFQSRLLPGLLVVHVQGNITIPMFPGEPPSEVDSGISQIVFSSYNYRQTVAFGPRFDPATSPAKLAEEYGVSLSVAIAMNLIDGQGAFVRDLRNRFGKAQQGGIYRWPYGYRPHWGGC